MNKIVFFDIDGTLLDHDKKLPASTKEAIFELKENGVYVAIATGRAPFMFEHIRKDLEIESYVCFNGQYVVFENEVIYKNPLKTNLLESLVNISKSRQHPLVFLNEKTMKANVQYDESIVTSMESLKLMKPEYDPDFYKDKEIYQSLLFCEEKDENYYRDHFPEILFIRWHELSMDVIPKGGSKAEGIKKMIERLGFNLSDVFAFGDGLNDIEMLSTVGTGVAMGNATDIVKQNADMITNDVAEDGIFNGLKKLHLI
ncbi:Cof-type HAD-IIB family hydrolase [Bacillus sp. APMAM]|nr:Cof-type HAD-IIB family hydrolase [Bacillus sp. APMAM]RTZ57473.1 Cof-type HAD-IIB family hydrolase [Bacillus sp. SAJ1]